MRIEDHPTVKRLGLLARPETGTGRATELHVDVASLRQFALDGYIFACQAEITGDVVIDA
jgi:hypothetical protein